MNELIEHDIRCPYCDESITVLIDGSVSEQSYVEDCHVCCRPIVLAASVDAAGNARAIATAENE